MLPFVAAAAFKLKKHILRLQKLQNFVSKYLSELLQIYLRFSLYYWELVVSVCVMWSRVWASCCCLASTPSHWSACSVRQPWSSSSSSFKSSQFKEQFQFLTLAFTSQKNLNLLLFSSSFAKKKKELGKK